MRICRRQRPECDVRYEDGDLANRAVGRCLGSSSRPSMRATGFSDMTPIRALTTLATAALLLVVVTGCADKGSNPEPTPSMAPSPSASRATTPSSPGSSGPNSPASASTDSEVAAQAASDAVHKYYAAVDKVRQDASQPASILKTVATGTELSAQQTFLEKQRKTSRRQTGALQIQNLSVESVNLSTPATVQVHVCWDVRGVDVLDSQGKSVVTAARAPVGWSSLTVSNPRFTRDPLGAWRVSASSDLKAPPCAAS